MNIGKEIYKVLKQHCGNEPIKGSNPTTLNLMEKGKAKNITTGTIKALFEKNGLEAKIEVKHNHKGIETTTIINF